MNRSMDGGVESRHAHRISVEQRLPAAVANANAEGSVGGRSPAGVAPGPSTLLTGRAYIPSSEHTGASGLRSFLDRQIARGLKPREHKDYFTPGTF